MLQTLDSDVCFRIVTSHMKHRQKVIKSGTWLYDGQVEKPILIIRQNWDYYHEEGYDPDPPDLNKAGEAYYLVYDGPDEQGRYHPQSKSCLSLEEAVRLAEGTIMGDIRWLG